MAHGELLESALVGFDPYQSSGLLDAALGLLTFGLATVARRRWGGWVGLAVGVGATGVALGLALSGIYIGLSGLLLAGAAAAAGREGPPAGRSPRPPD